MTGADDRAAPASPSQSVPPDVVALDDSRCDDAESADTGSPQSGTSGGTGGGGTGAIIEPKPAAVPLTSPDLAPIWSKVIRAEGVSPLLRAVLTNSSLASLSDGKASIVCAPRYAPDAQRRWLVPITEVLGRVVGSPVEVTIRSADGAAVAAPATAAPTPAVSESPRATGAEAESAAQPVPRVSNFNAAEHPLVKQALELFGGRIVDVQPRRPN